MQRHLIAILGSRASPRDGASTTRQFKISPTENGVEEIEQDC